MKRKTRKALNITADHAARALHALIAEGKLAARDVLTALKRREKLIKELRDRFTALASEAAPAVVQARKSVARKSSRGRRARTSAEKGPAKGRGRGRRAGVQARRKRSAAPAYEPAAPARSAKRRAASGARPAPVEIRKGGVTKKTSILTERKPRPRTPTPARGADGHALPDPGTPEFETRGPAAPRL